MKFYGRDKELKRIADLKKRITVSGSEIAVITGRRRIGKTRLALESVQDSSYLYFFVTRKKENELLQDWAEQIKRQLGNVIFGKFASIDDLLEFLYEYTKTRELTVIFDEFQNFYLSKPEIYSIFQKYHDQFKAVSKMLLIFSGSSYTLMEKIFKGSKEPLFGRAADIIHLSYLSISTQWQYAEDIGIYSQKDLLDLFSVFDGVPRYMEEIFHEKGSFRQRLAQILKEKEWIWEEGENILKEEFGKDYSSYYSILSAIAKGRRILSEIQQYSGIRDASPYLKKLDSTYRLIKRRLPITDLYKNNSRNGRYYINDNFYAFWFKFIEPHRYLSEIGQKDLAVKMTLSHLTRYTGRLLEDLVTRYIIEDNPKNWEFTRIGRYWDRKGKIELDVLVINDITKEAVILEVKRSKSKISSALINEMKEKVEEIGELRTYKKKFGYATLNNGNLIINIENE